MRSDIANRTEAGKASNRPVHLVKIELGCSNDITATNASECLLGEWTEPIYVTNWSNPITWDGNEYLAVGHFMGLGNISESATLEIPSLTLSLSGVDQEYIALLLTKNYMDRPVTLHRSFVDSGSNLITTPFEIFRGTIDTTAINDDPKTTSISISVKNHLADFQKKSGRHTNHAEMQRYFPGDNSFNQASESSKEIKWGRE